VDKPFAGELGLSWTYEIALRGAPGREPGLQTWLHTCAHETFAGLPGLACLDLYMPAGGPAKDPYVHDGAGPLMVLMLDFATRDALAAAIAGDRIMAAADALAPDIAGTGMAFERRFYPAGGDATPAPLLAPFSYVVRYHRPADDEAAFVRNYLATHPAVEARLPGIRSIMCYLPLDDMCMGGPARLPSAGYMIGNEVVFDDIAAFNAAMASPIRQELRAHYDAFPRFTGANTHYPMIRRRLVK
jgi:uncharacterized protein (TIGR02118 family)